MRLELKKVLNVSQMEKKFESNPVKNRESNQVGNNESNKAGFVIWIN